VEVAVHAGHAFEALGHVLGLGLDFLHAHTIGARAFGPFHEALVGGGTDAIQVERDKPESHEN
jgi:hypothetical protein